MSKRDNYLLLEDILEAAQKIQKYCNGLNFQSFIEDEKTIDAVIRNFEVIGEASGRIDPDFKIQHSQIEWNMLKGFRNRLIHEYFGIDNEIVWEIVNEDLDPLIRFLNSIIKNN